MATFIKKHLFMWLAMFTVFAVFLVVGLSLSTIVNENTVSQLQHMSMWPLFNWRVCFYAVLVWVWPWLIKRIARKRLNKNDVSPKRLPLIVTILLYELVIVQNPLAKLIRLF